MVYPDITIKVREISKFIGLIFIALVISVVFWLALWFLSVITPYFYLLSLLVIVFLYWPGRKHKMLFNILGPILVLELVIWLTLKLIIVI
jgi:cbb3-type cytochrome oxidase subunit 3